MSDPAGVVGDEGVDGGDEGDDRPPETTEAVRILRATEAERDALIERYGVVGKVEREIADELAAFRPLADPDGFPEAHRRAMYAIEVLDRNGARPAAIPRVGPLTPIASFVVGLVARWIVRGHQARLIGDMRHLYSRREAISEPMSLEHQLLRRARFHATLVEQGYRGNPVGLPAFVVGGAVLTSVASGLEVAALTAFGSQAGGVIALFSIGAVLLGASWCALRAAGVARRRIRMTSDASMVRLWSVIGACGRPPRDQSFLFAIVAIVLAALSVLVVPFVIYVVFGV